MCIVLLPPDPLQCACIPPMRQTGWCAELFMLMQLWVALSAVDLLAPMTGLVDPTADLQAPMADHQEPMTGPVVPTVALLEPMVCHQEPAADQVGPTVGHQAPAAHLLEPMPMQGRTMLPRLAPALRPAPALPPRPRAVRGKAARTWISCMSQAGPCWCQHGLMRRLQPTAFCLLQCAYEFFIGTTCISERRWRSWQCHMYHGEGGSYLAAACCERNDLAASL